MLNIDIIAVLGAGQMGNGIAQVCAQAGFQVQMLDINEECLSKAMETIKKSLSRLASAGKLDEAKIIDIIDHIKTTTSLSEAVNNASVVIEALPENLDIKKKIFSELDKICPPETIFATNTTELSISAIAAVTKTPGRVIGMHWFYPPPVMRLIEIIKAINTSEETIKTIVYLSHRLGKETVIVKDSQGFVTSRIFVAHMVESMRVLEEGVASAGDIDLAIKLGLNYPMGPLELADFVGLDTVLYATHGMVEAYGDRFKPPQVLCKLVEANNLGRKTGKGFYQYSK
ncbi:MAG: 3-hydroxybutyryl-CoA dehydrogenase [Peptococcaceae bacterium BRH_c4b]|nr:MAG: 3-hydroxybutyryl-CoA dehydrogenase [Peptococcaceae bacterium BRH_c4b]